MTEVSPSGDANEDELYLVDSIVDRRVRRGRVEYRVRWKGFPPDQDSWEPFTNLKEPCLPLIQEFHNRYRKENQEKRRSAMPTVLSASRSRANGRTSDQTVLIPETNVTPQEHNLATSSISCLSDMSQQSSRSSRKKADSFTGSTGRVSPVSDRVPNHSAISSAFGGSISINPAGLIASSPPKDVALRLSSSAVSTAQKNRPDNEYVDDSGDVSLTQRSAISNFTPSSTSSTVSRKRAVLKDADVPIQRLSADTKIPSLVAKSKIFSAPSVGRKSLHRDHQGKFVSPDLSTRSSRGSSPVRTGGHQEPVESGRKSVTIMLKACPTQEFHSTKDVRTQHLSTSGFTGNSLTKRPRRSGVSLHKTNPKVNPTKTVPDSHVAKVLDTVLKMRERRRRPDRSGVISLCNRLYGLSESSVLAGLDMLVSQNQLHEISYSDGISYRTSLTTSARGDMRAKIKARYNVNLTKRRHATLSRSAERKLSDSQSFRFPKKARKDPPMLNPSSRTQQSMNRFSVDRISAYTRPYRSNSLELKREGLSHPAFASRFEPEKKQSRDGNCNRFLPDQNARLKKLKVDPSTTVSNSEANSCPALTSNQLEPSVTPATTSRRTNNRRTDNAYKFKSILVRKNITGNFTEIWLQSPSSPLKNAFTIQVLEELTVALNQAVSDNSRLLMISGMGTVFSAGIDLVSLIGRLPNQFLIQPVSSDSSAASSASSNGECTGLPNCKSSASTTSLHSSVNSLMKARPIEDDQSMLPDNPLISQQMSGALRTFLLALASFPKPVVAGVNGPAIGLAVTMLPLCDLVYISDVATLHLPYNRLGQIPEGGASYTLTSLMGFPLANEVLLAGRKISAREAVQYGLASDLLFPKSFKQELIMRCHKLSSNSLAATELSKSLLRAHHRERIEEAVHTECRHLIDLWQTDRFRRCAVDVLMHEMGDFL